MKRRDFLKSAAIIPATAIPGMKTTESPDVFRAECDTGNLVIDYKDKKIYVSDRPRMEKIYRVMKDFHDTEEGLV